MKRIVCNCPNCKSRDGAISGQQLKKINKRFNIYDSDSDSEDEDFFDEAERIRRLEEAMEREEQISFEPQYSDDEDILPLSSIRPIDSDEDEIRVEYEAPLTSRRVIDSDDETSFEYSPSSDDEDIQVEYEPPLTSRRYYD